VLTRWLLRKESSGGSALLQRRRSGTCCRYRRHARHRRGRRRRRSGARRGHRPMVSVLRAKRQLREQQSKAAQNGATVPNELEKYDRAYAAALGASTCSCRSDVRRYAGKDIDFARDHLGHRVVQSTMTYAQISDARRNRTMRRLERSREFPIPS
jgi:hypothetical protein